MKITDKILDIVGRHGTEAGDDPEFDELVRLALGLADEVERGDVEYRVWYEDRLCNDNHVRCPELAYHPITNKNREDLDKMLAHYRDVIKTRTRVSVRRIGAWKVVKDFNEKEVKEGEL